MRPFTDRNNMQAAFQWVNSHADGECSILVRLPDPFGLAVYVCMGRGLPIWRTLQGPVAFR